MQSVRVIPCLDVDAGRVVKGVRFLGLRDAGDPAELAARYDAAGADELVFLDVSASAEGRDAVVEVVSRTADQVFIPLTVGGGVRSVEDARRLLRAGADKVAVNTAALDRPELVSELAAVFGAQCVVVAIDARRRETEGWEAYSHGGRRPTGRDVAAWVAEVVERGAGELLVTSMDRDGTQLGYDTELLRTVGRVAPVPLVASGGVGSVDDFVAAAVAGADAVLAASVFHYGTVTIAEAKAGLAAAGIVCRPVPTVADLPSPGPAGGRP